MSATMAVTWIAVTEDDTLLWRCGEDGARFRAAGCGEPFAQGEGAWCYEDDTRAVLFHAFCAP